MKLLKKINNRLGNGFKKKIIDNKLLFLKRSLSNSTIIDYGTYSLWGAILSGGEVVISKKTFRDARWAADYFKWTYM